MIKHQLVFNIFAMFICTGPLSAQDAAFDPAGKKKSDQEVYLEGSGKYSQVLLVPYSPSMHLPDPAGDAELVEHSGMEYNRMREHIRSSIDFYIAEKIKPWYKVIALSRSQTLDAKNDLEMLYGSGSYRYDDSKRAKSEANKGKSPGQKISGTFENLTKPKPHQSMITAGQLTVDTTCLDKQYMNVSYPDKKIFTYLHNRYGTDLFLFITQMEILKNFQDASDMAYGNYNRMVKVHYAMYDLKGDPIAGDVSLIKIESKTDEIKTITEETFPLAADMIVRDIPKPILLSPEMKMQKESQKKGEEQNLLKNK